jgi:glycosyltransferase involved in cell wall biosynthesis
LIVNNNLDAGGVQRALINLLYEIKDAYEITLFLFSCSGAYRDRLPEGINVIEASPLLNLLGLSQKQAGTKGRMLYLIRGLLALYAKIINNRLPIRFLAATQSRLAGFDAAISFLHYSDQKLLYGGCNEFVQYRVDARQKITFLHCDFSQYGWDTPRIRKAYETFDKIAAVSEGSRESFLKVIPKLAAKTYCVYNCHNYGEYQALANDHPVEYPGEGFNIITVARLGPEKGILRGIEVITRLKDEGYDLKWYIVGDGVLKKTVEEKIAANGAASYIFLCGIQNNPYRYMKNADVFLLPSFHEAAPMVYNEAKCLGIPLITTNTTSAAEMVREGQEGFVCENSEIGLYEALKQTLDHPEKLAACKEYLVKQLYSNEKAVRQFQKLIDNTDRC